MLAMYEVIDLLTRAQLLLDQLDETLIAANLSAVIELAENRLAAGNRPH